MKKPENLIELTASWVRQRCQAEGSHDWFHIERVWKTAAHLANREKAAVDRLMVELAALLHDIADAKYHDGDETIGPRLAREWLSASGQLDEARINHIVDIIATMSFRHGLDGFVPDPHDREFAVVRDADRLDAIGAIGIARAFAYGGAKGRPLHDPETQAEKFSDRQAYLQSAGTSLNHFYEKLFSLKDDMLTQAGKELAAERHAYMASFVERFLQEWEGRL